MSFNRYENFQRVASSYCKKCKEADTLFKKGGGETKKGLDLFIEYWSIINNLQIYSAKYSEKDDNAAKLCIEIAKTSVHCLAYTVDIETQINWHKAALKAARKLNDPRDIYLTANNLAIALTDAKREIEAIEILQECLKITNSLEDKSGEAKVLNSLGIAYKDLGQYSKAIEHHKKRLSIAKEIDDELGELHALANLGIVYKNVGNYNKALKYHYSRLKLAKKIKNPIKISNAFGDLGITYWYIKDFDKSVEFFNKQLRLTKRYKIQDGEGRALWGLSQSLHSQGKLQEAITNAKKALKIKKDKKDPLVSEIQNILLEWINESG
jgi:tetratricopeptide (TPR) repeat protein